DDLAIPRHARMLAASTIPRRLAGEAHYHPGAPSEGGLRSRHQVPGRVRRLILAVLAAMLVGAAPAAAAPPLTASVVGEAPTGGGVLRFPQAVAYSPGGGTIVVGDQFSGKVSVFGAAGDFRFTLGSRATRREPGRIGVVGGVAVDRD